MLTRFAAAEGIFIRFSFSYIRTDIWWISRMSCLRVLAFPVGTLNDLILITLQW